MQALEYALRRLAGRLPAGANFAFDASSDGLHLDALYLPPGRRGGGTAFLAAVLAEADRAGAATTLAADPTDEPGDPCTFELARWYARFGFSLDGVDDNDWVTMRREPRPFGGPGAVLAAYAEARANADMTREGFDAEIDRLAPRLRANL